MFCMSNDVFVNISCFEKFTSAQRPHWKLLHLYACPRPTTNTRKNNNFPNESTECFLPANAITPSQPQNDGGYMKQLWLPQHDNPWNCEHFSLRYSEIDKINNMKIDEICQPHIIIQIIHNFRACTNVETSQIELSTQQAPEHSHTHTTAATNPRTWQHTTKKKKTTRNSTSLSFAKCLMKVFQRKIFPAYRCSLLHSWETQLHAINYEHSEWESEKGPPTEISRPN